MRYRNPHPHTAVLPEHLAPDGTVHPTVAIEPGGQVDWPVPVASFDTTTEPARDTGAPQLDVGRGSGSAKKAPAVAADVVVPGEAKTRTGGGERA